MWAEGTTVSGRYRLGPLIGEGGHGAVFRATDTKMGRDVAIKVLHASRARGDQLEVRFEQEAHLARSLSHPNTVRMVDVGRAEDGERYIVYELLEGAPLSDRIAQAGRLDDRRVAHIGAQVLKSLMEAHALGFVHRDIKPSNIFLCDVHGDPDFVKVIDFGIAKSTEVGSGITRTGFVVGTPSYMAPEQVRGDEVTGATDLYALGLVLAEASTGQVIVTGATDAVVASRQLSPEPVELPPTVLQSPVGPAIHRATRKPLAQRYATAKQMLDDVLGLDVGGVTAGSQRTSVTSAGPSLGGAPTGVLAELESPDRARAKPTASPGRLLLLIVMVPLLIAVGVIGALVLSPPSAADRSAERTDRSERRKKRKKRAAPIPNANPSTSPSSTAAPSAATPTLPKKAKPVVADVLGALTSSELNRRLSAAGFKTQKDEKSPARQVIGGTWHGRDVDLFFTFNSAATFNHEKTLVGAVFHTERKTRQSPEHGLFVVCKEDAGLAKILLGELLGTPLD